MTRRLYPLVLLLVPLASGPVDAGPFSRKSAPRGDANARVPELLYHVKMDSDERKRAAAAEELRTFDPKQFPEIVPILCDVLETDKSAAVRLEAAQSLGKIRPVSPAAGQALEQASARDPAFKVRMQAWTSLRMYHLAGYRSGATPKDSSEFQIQVLNEWDGKTIILDPGTLQPLPLKSAVKTNPPPVETNDVPRPMPAGPNNGPSFSTSIPGSPPRVAPPPGPTDPDQTRSEPPR